VSLGGTLTTVDVRAPAALQGETALNKKRYRTYVIRSVKRA
jgi:hypothetical protein